MDNSLQPRAEEDALPESVVVNMPRRPGAQMVDGAAETPMGDGSFMIDLDGDTDAGGMEEQDKGDPTEHGANLAEHMAETDLMLIAQNIVQAVDQDVESRKPWFDMVANGIKKLGIEVNDADAREMGVFKIARRANYPLIQEALVQFQARFIAELFPPQGPVKTGVLGQRTADAVERAQRVEDYMNYQLTFDDPTYFEETDQLGFLLGIEGSIFRKGYQDPLQGKNVLRMVRAENLVVPYHATSLDSASRFTHRVDLPHNDLLKLQQVGFYRKTDVAMATRERDSGNSDGVMVEARDKAEGKQEPGGAPELEDDIPHRIEECYIDLDLAGFEHQNDAGEATGIKLPYVVHVERESQAVMAVYRNWKEQDPLKKKRVPFSHYRYLPGTGFYGWGLFHAIGGLDAAATGLLRTALVAEAFAGAGGGFKTKQGRAIDGQVELEPGVFKDVDAGYEDLQQAFWKPDFKGTSEGTFKLLGIITEAGQRFASTTENMVGDAQNTGPVGTTVALIEQGSKVFSGIHKRCHAAAGNEFNILADLDHEFMAPGETYPYEVEGASKEIMQEDFADQVRIKPVSDPNIYSSTQRIAIAQAGLDLANNSPDLFNRREANRRMLEALRSPDIDSLMPPKGKTARMDPVTENAMVMVGRGVKVFPDQNHQAHIAVHMGQLQLMVAQKSAALQTAQPLLVAHIAEHEAEAMRVQLMQDMGMQLPPMDLYAEDSAEGTPDIPPEVEDAIAVKAAGVMSALMKQLNEQQAAQATPAGPAQPDPAAEEARLDQSAAAKQQRDDAAAAAAEHRKDAALHAQVDREDALGGLDPASVKEAQGYLAKLGLDQMISPRQLSVVSRALGKSFDDTVRMIMAINSGGQGMGASPGALPYAGRR